MGTSNKSEALDGYVKTLTAMSATDDAHAVYEAWAADYENDLVAGYGYNAHLLSAQALAEACANRNARVLDLGCGTGLVGQALTEHGFNNIDGFDASEKMLEQARPKGIYRQLMIGDIRAPNALTADSYDAAIAVGVFGGGHVGPGDLEYFVRPVRAGGAIVLYANGIPFVADDYASHLRRLEQAGLWTVERSERTNYMAKLDRPGYLVVARRNGA